MRQDAQDHIQRALNETKRRRLEKDYGARFCFSDADAPPELIGQWLDTIEEFEQQLRAAPQTTVRAYTGNPAITPPELLPPDRIAQELRNLLAFLDAHAIAVHFGKDVPPEVVYRFVVDELLDHQIDDVRIDGLTHNFVYEDFHPDDDADATLVAGQFLRFLFKSDSEACGRLVDDAEAYSPSGKAVSRREMECAIEEFLRGVAVFTDSGISQRECKMQGEYAIVTFAVAWSGLRAGTLQEKTVSGMATVRMKRSCKGWNVVQVACPGWSTW